MEVTYIAVVEQDEGIVWMCRCDDCDAHCPLLCNLIVRKLSLR